MDTNHAGGTRAILASVGEMTEAAGAFAAKAGATMQLLAANLSGIGKPGGSFQPSLSVRRRHGRDQNNQFRSALGSDPR